MKAAALLILALTGCSKATVLDEVTAARIRALEGSERTLVIERDALKADLAACRTRVRTMTPVYKPGQFR